MEEEFIPFENEEPRTYHFSIECFSEIDGQGVVDYFLRVIFYFGGEVIGGGKAPNADSFKSRKFMSFHDATSNVQQVLVEALRQVKEE